MTYRWIGRVGWLLLVVMVASSAVAQQAAPKMLESDWKAIRAVISSQLRAFKADNDEQAFSHASPEIRKQFGTAAVFMTMVKSSYYPLYRPRSTEFLRPAVIEGQIIQPLQVVSEDGRVLVALYTMMKGKNKVWKISGCRLAPSKLEST